MELNRRPKYNAKKTVVDGIKFDSAKESRRYLELKEMHKAGEIERLRLQVPFVLVEGKRIAGKKVRDIVYVADFVYYKDGQMVVEDTKGMATREYLLKKKMMLLLWGIEIQDGLKSRRRKKK